MKYVFLCSFMILVCSCNNSGKNESAKITKRESLGKISWISGSWTGIYRGNPFYELYRLINDSTLEIVSYNWDGKDSSTTTRSMIRWINNNYYLGDSLNWKVIRITDTSIYMEPNYKALNSILWKKLDSNHWHAILTTQQAEIIYNMERVNHFPR